MKKKIKKKRTVGFKYCLKYIWDKYTYSIYKYSHSAIYILSALGTDKTQDPQGRYPTPEYHLIDL